MLLRVEIGVIMVINFHQESHINSRDRWPQAKRSIYD